MTLKQYRRLCSFALRMTHVIDHHYRKDCRSLVREVLEDMSEDCWSGIHYKNLNDWDYNEHGSYLCDFFNPAGGLADRHPYLCRNRPAPDGTWDTRLLNCVSSCIRAAFDVAVSPSAGVVGFTVGDLRKMWNPKPIPQWVLQYFPSPDAVLVACDDEDVWL
jgi:hypothetical protein